MVLTSAFAAAPAFGAEAVAIGTAEEFMAIANNPGGNYYLTNDITLPANTTICSQQKPFTGTLDGKGHAIKNYTVKASGQLQNGGAVFGSAKGAAFKNLSLTGVDIKINSANVIKTAPLVITAWDCSFKNIKTSGTITVSGSVSDGSPYYTAGGIIAENMNKSAVMDGCTNRVDISIDVKSTYWAGGEIKAAGIVNNAILGSVKNCKNYGDITVSQTGAYKLSAAGISNSCNNISSCSNYGNIKASDRGSKSRSASAAGIVCLGRSIAKSYNAGKISVTAGGDLSIVHAGGITGDYADLSKCGSKGSVSFSGKCREAYVGGLAGNSGSVKQSYNKGSVTAKPSAGDVSVGGLAGLANSEIKNCYNVGKVTLSGKGLAGGLAGKLMMMGKYVTNNYNKGSVTGSAKAVKAALIAYYDYDFTDNKCKVYSNYYTNSIKAYGGGSPTWYKTKPKAVKVSSITKSKCSKLSSSYWTYSSKYKRMILKYNKEK